MYLTAKNIAKKQHVLLPFEGDFEAAFSQPERTGTWLIWGQSGNGKSYFAMQLARELLKFGRVLYLSLEEGVSLSFKEKLQNSGMLNVNGFAIATDDFEELKTRLKKRRSADFVIIDSLQHFGVDYRNYKKLKKEFPNKLFIFISHCDGAAPSGRTAKSIRYDADMKIFVSGYVATTQGRYIGNNGGNFVIWQKGVDTLTINDNPQTLNL